MIKRKTVKRKAAAKPTKKTVRNSRSRPRTPVRSGSDVVLQLTADERRDMDLLVSTRGWSITRIFLAGLRRVSDYESSGGLSALQRKVTESE